MLARLLGLVLGQAGRGGLAVHAHQVRVAGQRARGGGGARRLVAAGGGDARGVGPEERRVLVIGIGLGGGDRVGVRVVELAELLGHAGQVEPGPAEARARLDHLLELGAGGVDLAGAGQGAGQAPARPRCAAVAVQRLALAARGGGIGELPLVVEDVVAELALVVEQHRLGIEPAEQEAVEGRALLDPLAGVLLEPPDGAVGRDVEVVGVDGADVEAIVLAAQLRGRQDRQRLVEQIAAVVLAVEGGQRGWQRGVEDRGRRVEPVYAVGVSGQRAAELALH